MTEAKTPNGPLQWKLLVKKRDSDPHRAPPPGNPSLVWVTNTVTLLYGERDGVLVDIGHTDTSHSTCLHVPSIDLVIAGDAVYNGAHLYLGESNKQGRLDWLRALDKIEALKPRMVVTGHGVLEPDSDLMHIQETRQYLLDFNRMDESTT